MWWKWERETASGYAFALRPLAFRRQITSAFILLPAFSSGARMKWENVCEFYTDSETRALLATEREKCALVKLKLKQSQSSVSENEK